MNDLKEPLLPKEESTHKFIRVVTRAFLILLVIELSLQSIAFIHYLYLKKNSSVEKAATLENLWWLEDSRYNWLPQELQQVKFVYDPFRAWKMGEVRTPNITVNQEGVRKTVGNPSNANEAKSVYFFGGSTMWGYNAPDDQTIASYFAQEANKNQPLYTVTNYGQMGYTHTQELIQLLMLLREGKVPDFVIFYDGCNDMYVPTLDKDFRNIYREKFLETVFEENNAFGYVLPSEAPIKNTTLLSRANLQNLSKYIKIIHYPLEIYQRITDKQFDANPEQLPYTFAQNEIDTFAQHILNNYDFGYSMIEMLAKSYNFKYLTVLQPILVNKDSITPQELQYEESILGRGNLENYQTLYRQIGESLQKKQYKNHYDLGYVVKNNQDNLFFDECHVIPETNQVIAKEMLKLFEQQL